MVMVMVMVIVDPILSFSLVLSTGYQLDRPKILLPEVWTHLQVWVPTPVPGDFGSHWPHGVHLLEMAAVPVPGTPGRGHESCAALVDCCSKAGCWRRAADTLVEMQGRSMDAGAMGGKPQRNHFLRRNIWNIVESPDLRTVQFPEFGGESPMLGLILVGEIHISVLQNQRFCSVK